MDFPYKHRWKLQEGDPFELCGRESAWLEDYNGGPDTVANFFSAMNDFFSNGSNAGTPGSVGYDGDNKALLIAHGIQHERLARMLEVIYHDLQEVKRLANK